MARRAAGRTAAGRIKKGYRLTRSGVVKTRKKRSTRRRRRSRGLFGL
jgi:hypothetical protein